MLLEDDNKMCVICSQTFPLGHYYTYHVAECLSLRREYIKTNPLRKREIVLSMEFWIRKDIPGALLGFGE